MQIHKHISLSGLRGFLVQFDDEQSQVLIDTIHADLHVKLREFREAFETEDREKMQNLCKSIEQMARPFQLDLLVDDVLKTQEHLATGPINKSQISEFLNLFNHIVTALKKLKNKGFRTDRMKTKKKDR